MLPTLIIVFREVIEAGLIVGIVFAATQGVPRRTVWIGYGILGGIASACLVAAFAGTISMAVSGVGQEIFNASILLIAVIMLIWHNVWMARHGQHIASEMKEAGEAVASGKRSLVALAVVVGIAVMREGSEIVLFLYGIALSGGNSTMAMVTGGILGLLLGAAISALTYFGLLRIPSRHLFTVTSWLIALLAAGMASQAIAFLQQADIVTAFAGVVWNTSTLLSNGSMLGRALHTLVGYTDQPTGVQLAAYVMTLVVIFVLTKFFGRKAASQQM